MKERDKILRDDCFEGNKKDLYTIPGILFINTSGIKYFNNSVRF